MRRVKRGTDRGKRDKSGFTYTILTVMAVCCGLVWSVTNLGYDGEYQLAMCNRLLQGDKMFLEMWEPHQTSVFLPAALMWVYRKLMGTTTGIVIYLQICGILIRGGLAVLLYRTLRKELPRRVAYCVGLLYFMIAPKDYALPEFSNLQLWFSTLLFICLWEYLKSGRKILLILSGIWLSLEVLAYPSCVVVFPGVLLLLARYSARRKRDILLLTGICAGAGVAVAGYFLVSIRPDRFAACIAGMLALEPTHTESVGVRLAFYGENILVLLLVSVGVALLGFILSLPVQMLCDRKGKRSPFLPIWMLCCCAVLLAGFLANILSAENRCAYSVILLLLTGIGFCCRGSLEGRERQIYTCGSIIGGLELLATLMLSDLPFSVSVPYGLLMAAMSLIPIEKQIARLPEEKLGKGFYYCFGCFAVLLAFRCVYIRTPISGKGQICSTFSGMALARSGPALGLVSNEDGISMQRDSYQEWKELIRPGDKVWIIGGVVDTLGYLYEEVEVAGPSTMSTPYYSDVVISYWDINPDKYPDVIVAECYLGELSYDLLANQWLMDWMEEEYRPEQVVEGVYWNYYFRKGRK